MPSLLLIRIHLCSDVLKTERFHPPLHPVFLPHQHSESLPGAWGALGLLGQELTSLRIEEMQFPGGGHISSSTVAPGRALENELSECSGKPSPDQGLRTHPPYCLLPEACHVSLAPTVLPRPAGPLPLSVTCLPQSPSKKQSSMPAPWSALLIITKMPQTG